MDVAQYELAVADPLALESLALVKKINNDQRTDLNTLCQQVMLANKTGSLEETTPNARARFRSNRRSASCLLLSF